MCSTLCELSVKVTTLFQLFKYCIVYFTMLTQGTSIIYIATECCLSVCLSIHPSIYAKFLTNWLMMNISITRMKIISYMSKLQDDTWQICAINVISLLTGAQVTAFSSEKVSKINNCFFLISLEILDGQFIRWYGLFFNAHQFTGLYRINCII